MISPYDPGLLLSSPGIDLLVQYNFNEYGHQTMLGQINVDISGSSVVGDNTISPAKLMPRGSANTVDSSPPLSEIDNESFFDTGFDFDFRGFDTIPSNPERLDDFSTLTDPMPDFQMGGLGQPVGQDNEMQARDQMEQPSRKRKKTEFGKKDAASVQESKPSRASKKSGNGSSSKSMVEQMPTLSSAAEQIKARNRAAATKCRLKKREEHDNLIRDYQMTGMRCEMYENALCALEQELAQVWTCLSKDQQKSYIETHGHLPKCLAVDADGNVKRVRDNDLKRTVKPYHAAVINGRPVFAHELSEYLMEHAPPVPPAGYMLVSHPANEPPPGSARVDQVHQQMQRDLPAWLGHIPRQEQTAGASNAVEAGMTLPFHTKHTSGHSTPMHNTMYGAHTPQSHASSFHGHPASQ